MYRPQLTALLLAATIPAAAQHTLRGRVLEGESPVGYATTVLLRDGRQAAGTTTDDAGGFVLTADTFATRCSISFSFWMAAMLAANFSRGAVGRLSR